MMRKDFSFLLAILFLGYVSNVLSENKFAIKIPRIDPDKVAMHHQRMSHAIQIKTRRRLYAIASVVAAGALGGLYWYHHMGKASSTIFKGAVDTEMSRSEIIELFSQLKNYVKQEQSLIDSNGGGIVSWFSPFSWMSWFNETGKKIIKKVFFVSCFFYGLRIIETLGKKLYEGFTKGRQYFFDSFLEKEVSDNYEKLLKSITRLEEILWHYDQYGRYDENNSYYVIKISDEMRFCVNHLEIILGFISYKKEECPYMEKMSEFIVSQYHNFCDFLEQKGLSDMPALLFAVHLLYENLSYESSFLLENTPYAA